MTSRKIPESAVENLVSDLEGKANVANTVTTDTAQIITGHKIFTTEPLRKSTVIDITTKPENYMANNVRFVDKNNNAMGFLENAQQSDGSIKTGIHARNKDGYQPHIGVYAPLSGTTGAYATAPNTPDNAPANAIVTKDKIANMVTTDTAQTISGVKTFTGNTIVNGGAGNGTFTIKNNVTTYGTSAVDLVVATSNKKNQLLVHFQEGNKWCAYFDQDPSTKNITFSLTPCAAVYAPTPAVASNDAQVATTAWVRNLVTPTGTIIIWSATNPPAGYLICDGAAISRTTYAALFQVIGTTWGAGDGNTTFNIPNFVDRIPQGRGSRGGVGSYLAERLPNISGTTGFSRSTSGDGWVSTYNPSGCFYQASTNTGNGIGSSHTDVTVGVLGFAASNSSSTYQNNAPVQQAASVCNFCIKY